MSLHYVCMTTSLTCFTLLQMQSFKHNTQSNINTHLQLLNTGSCRLIHTLQHALMKWTPECISEANTVISLNIIYPLCILWISFVLSIQNESLKTISNHCINFGLDLMTQILRSGSNYCCRSYLNLNISIPFIHVIAVSLK